MWLTLLAVAVGLASGLVAGGSLRSLTTAKPAGVVLAALWVGLTVATRWATIPHGRLLFFLANVCALMFCALNMRRLSAWVLFAGLALNTLVIGLNGSMPYRVSSVISAELAAIQDDFPSTVQTRPERDSDHLSFLDDNIAIHAGPIKDVLSIGDAVGALGMAWIVYRLTQNSVAKAVVKLPGSTTKKEATRAKPAKVSALKLGEEHDLDDEHADEHDEIEIEPENLVELEPVTTSSSRLLLDLTADRAKHPERYQTGSNAAFEKLAASIALHDDDQDPDQLLDITVGDVPGDTFWHERAIQRGRDARAAQSPTSTPMNTPMNIR
jgi:Family of unknown function (DUF5317)